MSRSQVKSIAGELLQVMTLEHQLEQLRCTNVQIAMTVSVGEPFKIKNVYHRPFLGSRPLTAAIY